MKKRIAIIPARGGSKRIPGKNIRDFLAKPMIAHILAAAKASRLFDKIHVSTDSQEVSDVVNKLGYDIDFMRPTHLSGDLTPLTPVIKYVINNYTSRGEEFDEVWLLMACAPLVSSADLLGASRLFDEHGGKFTVLSVLEYPVPVEWAFEKTGMGELHPVQPGMFSRRSQDLEKKYYDAGAFMVFNRTHILTIDENGSDQNLLGFVLPKSRAIDIDDEDDWIIAEAMASRIIKS